MQALRSFSRAVHINPACTELRKDDLMWALELVHRKASFDRDNLALVASSSSSAAAAADSETDDSDDEPCVHEMKQLPPNCVIIRD